MGTIKVFFKFFCQVCGTEVFKAGFGDTFHCKKCDKNFKREELIKDTEKIDYA